MRHAHVIDTALTQRMHRYRCNRLNVLVADVILKIRSVDQNIPRAFCAGLGDNIVLIGNCADDAPNTGDGTWRLGSLKMMVVLKVPGDR